MIPTQEEEDLRIITSKRNEIWRRRVPQYIAALSACLGSVCTGAVEGWTGNISEDMKKLSFNGITITEDHLGLIGSLSSLGSVFACIPSAYLSDWVGRKTAILLLIVPLLLGWLLIILAQEFWMLGLGRLLCGITDGAFYALLPMYVTEISEKDIRGGLTAYFDLFLTVGILVSFTVANFLDIYQYTIVVGCLPILFGLIFCFQPESPIFLAMKGKEKEASQSLHRLRKRSYNVTDEVEGIKLIVNQNHNHSLLTTMRKKYTRRVMLICFPLTILQPMSGITVITYYTASIFASTKVDLDEKLCTVIFGMVTVFSAFLTTLVIDKLGRRTMLITSLLGSSLAIGILALFFTLQYRQLVDESVIAALHFLPIVSVSLFTLTFSLGYGTVPWLLISELFPPEIKSLAAGCGATFNLTSVFLVSRYYFDLKSAMGIDITFYLSSIINLITAVFVYYYVPETSGKSFAELQALFRAE